ncbi:MAG: hypothetical protein H6750_15780 [Nitrospiraceae bacterium]|nr:hypothetical protein [Nitrospiraceae bacterium]
MYSLISQRLTRSFRSTGWGPFVCMWGVGLWVLMSGAHVIAQAPNVPWECSGYSGEAQIRCLQVLPDLQQNHIAKLEAQLSAQERTANNLKEKMDRHEALASRDARVYKPDPRFPLPYVPAYASPYAYAPFGIYLRPPWTVSRYYGVGAGYWRQPGLSFHFRYGGGHRHRH